MVKHRMRWFAYAGSERIPRTSAMRGSWGYDVECSCGEFATLTGGGTRRYVLELADEHKRLTAASTLASVPHMTNPLIAAQSTVADAAAHYAVSVHKILSTLHESLTDVYTAADGHAGVISDFGHKYATVNGEHGHRRVPAAGIVLAGDSVAVLARYLGGKS
jgi:hypothetical protein